MSEPIGMENFLNEDHTIADEYAETAAKDNPLDNIPDGWTRKELNGGYYYYIAPSSDPRDPPDVWLCDPTNIHLMVAFDSDACFNESRIKEGVERKIAGVEAHLVDLKKALKVLSNNGIKQTDKS